MCNIIGLSPAPPAGALVRLCQGVTAGPAAASTQYLQELGFDSFITGHRPHHCVQSVQSSPPQYTATAHRPPRGGGSHLAH